MQVVERGGVVLEVVRGSGGAGKGGLGESWIATKKVDEAHLACF